MYVDRKSVVYLICSRFVSISRLQLTELTEVKRQQRKLNFLITQTELYAHFMSRKLGNGSEEEQLKILNQLDEDSNAGIAQATTSLVEQDDYDW